MKISKPKFLRRFLWKRKAEKLQKKVESHSLGCLNIAQLLGALNDNIYKLALIFFAIRLYGTGAAEDILSAAGAVFVIPFLLFSSTAGIIADRVSKKTIVVIAKALEIVITFLAIVAFLYQSTWFGYLLLFFLAAQSTLFSPAKYGIIPEIVKKEDVSKANGLIVSSTYVAIIVGTFLASFLTDISDYNFPFVAAVCFGFALIGFFVCFGIKNTPASGSKRKARIFFLKEIYDTLKESAKTPPLLATVVAAAFFLFVGAYVQLNIIPYAIRHLGLSEVAGGYLFLASAGGIAIGAFLAGRVSRERIELGLSLVSMFSIGVFLVLLGVFPSSLVLVCIFLVFLGLFGGFFIIPLDSYIQVYSPPTSRGHVIASSNFLSFCGVLLASGALFFFSTILGFSPAGGFFLTGLLTLVLFGIFFAPFALFLPSFLGKHVLSPLFDLEMEDDHLLEHKGRRLFILQDASPLKLFLLAAAIKEIRLLFPTDQAIKRTRLFEMLFSCTDIEDEKLHLLHGDDPLFCPSLRSPCVYLRYPLSVHLAKSTQLLNKLRRAPIEVVYTRVEWEKQKWGDYFLFPFKGKITLSLEEKEL